MYDQIKEDVLYIMLYAVVMAMAITASCYLLFRRGNAFATDVTTPLRLRLSAKTFLLPLFLPQSHMMNDVSADSLGIINSSKSAHQFIEICRALHIQFPLFILQSGQ